MDVAWFCVCKLGVFIGGGWMEVWWWWYKCECVGRQKGLCGSSLICVTSMHSIKSIRMFDDIVTWPEHALVIQGGSLGGLGWWSVVCNLMNVWPSLGCLSILTRCFPPFLFLCVDFECNRDSLLATVFSGCYEFNGDLNQWDVAKVSDVNKSKLIHIWQNDNFRMSLS